MEQLKRIDREERERAEGSRLALAATRSADSRGRERAEAPDPLRTAFERDRDRIVHSNAIRRLAHKTQVFIAPDNDHFVTRLTHTLQVAQIGRSMAAALGLNEALTEAVCLGHDIGHAPFGHTGEDALAQIVARVGENLGPYRLGVFREAMPGGIEDSTLVFEVSPDKTFLLEKLSGDPKLGPYIAEQAGELLGRSGLTVSFRLTGGGPSSAPPEQRPGAVAPPPSPPPPPDSEAPPPPETPPPLDGDLPSNRPPAPRRSAAVDPLPLLQEELGATVLEESSS